MRRKIIAGNWKMNKTTREALVLVEELKREISRRDNVEIVVCPPFTSLSEVGDALHESGIGLGAQHCDWRESGAFTGEVAVGMLKDLDVRYCIIGHSERRQYFGETNETVNKRLLALLQNGLTPIVCIGENLVQREGEQTFEIIQDQLAGSLAGLTALQITQVVLAYEPVWAIGTGKTATPEQAQEVHAFIRSWLTKNFSAEAAQGVRIQYGGSVTADNAAQLLKQVDIDGALVGGASLKAPSFASIVKAA